MNYIYSFKKLKLPEKLKVIIFISKIYKTLQYLLFIFYLNIAYEQQFVRNMFFEKVEKKFIDGTEYTVSNAAMVDTWNCKEALVDIYNILDKNNMDMNCGPENYTTWKKDLLKLCKTWDSAYMKHIKTKVYDEMNLIHVTAMKPL